MASSVRNNVVNGPPPIEQYQDNYQPPGTARSASNRRGVSPPSQDRPNTHRGPRGPAGAAPIVTIVGHGTTGLGAKCRDDYSKQLAQKFEAWKNAKEDSYQEAVQTKRAARNKNRTVPDQREYEAQRKREREVNAARREEQMEERLRMIRERTAADKAQRKQLAKDRKTEEEEFHRVYVAENVQSMKAAAAAKRSAKYGGSSSSATSTNGGGGALKSAAHSGTSSRGQSPPSSGRRVVLPTIDDAVSKSIEEYKHVAMINRQMAHDERALEQERVRKTHDKIINAHRHATEAKEKQQQERWAAAQSVREQLKSKVDQFGGEKTALQEARAKWAKDIYTYDRSVADRRSDWQYDHEQVASVVRKEDSQLESAIAERKRQEVAELRIRVRESRDGHRDQLHKARIDMESSRARRAEDLRVDTQRMKSLAVQDHENRSMENSLMKEFLNQPRSPRKAVSPNQRTVSPASPIPLKYRPRPPPSQPTA